MKSISLRLTAVAALSAGLGCGSGSTTSTPAPTTPPPAPAPAPDTSAEPAPPEVPTPQGNPSADLIPREVLFGNPEKASPEISPDGKHLAFLAPRDGVLNVWVAPVGQLDAAKPVTDDKTRPVRTYGWAYTSNHIIYQQDTGGDEDWHIYSVDLTTGKTLDLTPGEKIQGQIVAASHKQPRHIVVGINDRNPQLHDLYRVDITTGDKTRILENPGFIGFGVDANLAVRVGVQLTPDGGQRWMRPKNKELSEWADLLTVPQEDALTTNLLDIDEAGKRAYIWDSRDRDTSGLMSMDLTTGKTKLLAENKQADGSQVLLHPKTRQPQAVAFTYLRREWQPLNATVRKDFEALRKVAEGEIGIASRTLDDRTWVVAFADDDGPIRYYLYDRKSRKPTFLFVHRQDLEKAELAAMTPVVIESRDGLNLVSYLTLPKGADADGDGRPEQAQPMVLLVHGGPWARDAWGYNPLHQLLADRGYAALSVNFRGSTGFGKAFINAANMEWGKKMHDDLIDAVNWAVQAGVAEKDRVCIMGGSYGGYATLAGLTLTPDVFACGVDIVGPSNIITLLESIPPYWAPMIDMFKTRVGDWTTEEGKQRLLAVSPLSHVDKITKPLLIGQGANDPRVKQAESDQIVKAMQQKGIPVTYVLFPDEGHGFARTENRLAFWAVTEAFLSAYLGGTYQPYGAADFAGSTIQVPTGARAVPGLAEAMSQHAQAQK